MLKLLKIFCWVSLMALSLTSGVYAVFNSQITSPGMGISAGTLYLGLDESHRGILEGSLELSKMVPGEEPREFRLSVKNVGDLKGYINGISATIKDSDHKFIANAIHVNCTGPNGESLYSGSLLSLDGNAVPTDGEVEISPEESKDLTFSFQIDHRTGGWCKGKNIELSLTVYAGQKSGQKLETNVIIAGRSLRETLGRAVPGSVVLVPAGEYESLTVNSPHITVKAKDVAMDTVLGGIHLAGEAENVTIQGFIVNGKGRGKVLKVSGACNNASICDNIFQNHKARDIKNINNHIELGRSRGLSILRNDFSPLTCGLFPDYFERQFRPADISTHRSQNIRYNLGLDLDPSVEAL
ncbi:MAG: hypothetical protein ACOY46_08270 [Bacillota bacterium]